MQTIQNVGENMYKALYRKFRPQTFDEVLGQDHITNILKNQIKMNNIGHAYLFSGTRGTGKTSTAKIFSRAVNCLDLKDGNPCNECEICKGILDESIMDVIEMDAASNRGIDDIRDLKDKVVYPPTRARYKVYIIDEVHMLSTPAFNALLKTLEEPPKHLIFILATTEPEKLLQTILSRCQRFDFKRVKTGDIVKNLKMITDQMGMEVEEEVLYLIGRNTDGAMRDALSLLDQCMSFSTGKITYEEAITILGMVDKTVLLDIVENTIRGNLEEGLKSFSQIIDDGKDVHQLIKDLTYEFRNLMYVKATKNPRDLLEIDDTILDRYFDLVKNIDLDFIFEAIDILSLTDEKAKWSQTPRILLEMALVQIGRINSLEKSQKKVQEKPLERPPVERPQKERPQKESLEAKKPETKEVLEEVKVQPSPSQVGGQSLDLKTLEENWDKVLQAIKSKKVNIYALLMEGRISGFGDSTINISYKEGFGFHKEAVSNEQNKGFIEEVISNYFGQKLFTRFTMESLDPLSPEEENKIKEKAIDDVISTFGKDFVQIEREEN